MQTFKQTYTYIMVEFNSPIRKGTRAEKYLTFEAAIVCAELFQKVSQSITEFNHTLSWNGDL